MFTKSVDEHEKRIPLILDRVDCRRHGVPKGIPCFHIASSSLRFFGYLPGICGKRIKAAGYDGKISPTSLQLKASSGRSARNKR